MSDTRELDKVSGLLRAAREGVNLYALQPYATDARRLLAVVVDHHIAALSRLRDRLNKQQQPEHATHD